MNQFLLEHSFVYTLTIFVAVVLVKILLSIFFIKEPMHLFRFFCTQLAKKVNNPQHSSKQQKIAGTLAALITLAPLMTILWLFESFIEVSWLWHGFLLYFALGSFGLTRTSIKTARALAAKKTYDAKLLINSLTLRENNNLSSLGITKACIEMQILQTIQQCFTVTFFYFLAGPYMALLFRLLLEIHYSWNIKKQQFQNFGSSTNSLVQLLQWLPTRIYVTLMMLGTLGQNFILFWQLIKKHFFTLNNSIAVYALALALEKKLGGVAMYNNEKLRRISFNDNALEPEPSDIIHATKRTNQVLYFAFLCVIFSVMLYSVLTIKA